MPEHDLQSQLEELRSQLAQDTPLTDEERASLQAIAQDIEARLATEGTTEYNDSLVDGVNLAVERFEVSHRHGHDPAQHHADPGQYGHLKPLAGRAMRPAASLAHQAAVAHHQRLGAAVRVDIQPATAHIARVDGELSAAADAAGPGRCAPRTARGNRRAGESSPDRPADSPAAAPHRDIPPPHCPSPAGR